MTKSNNKWVPEVGDKVKSSFNDTRATVLGVKGLYAWLEDVDGFQSTALIKNLIPIKTEAEKRRDVLEEILTEELAGITNPDLGLSICISLAKQLVEANWIKPKPLTDDVIAKLQLQSASLPMLVRETDKYIRGELNL